MIEKIIDDVKREQKDAEVEEKKVVAEFRQHITDSQSEFDARMEEMTTKVSRRAKLEVQIGADTDDRDEVADGKKGTEEKLVALGRECDAFLKGFDDATKARTFEIAQLW